MSSSARTAKFHQLIGWTAAIACGTFGVSALAEALQGRFDGAAGMVLISLLIGWLARIFVRDSTYAGH